ncbi:MAG: methylated-DNA--[protein]-cysteine S-methyltransferase [Rhodoferax sp.]|nr:methylated-DNA--[protein]-cysteine S-methyltransferase [Rhodoferax sp.]
MPNFTTAAQRCQITTPLGAMTLAATNTALLGAWFEGQQHQPDVAQWPLADRHPVLAQAAAQLQQYFAGQRQQFELPLDLSAGTPFQQDIWRALLALGHGHTSSYGAIASTVQRDRAVRAVGAAVGRNPISIIVPCHRVLGANGALTGYAGGLERKTALLQLERSA